MQLAAFDGPSSKTPYKRKNLAKISYTTRVIANLVSNFVAISTGSVGKNAIGSIQWPISENAPINAKNLAKIFYTTRAIANIVPNFVPITTGVGREKCN